MVDAFVGRAYGVVGFVGDNELGRRQSFQSALVKRLNTSDCNLMVGLVPFRFHDTVIGIFPNELQRLCCLLDELVAVG